MTTSDFSKAESKQSFKSLKYFLNGNNKREYAMKFPLLDKNGHVKGYCLQKYDKWCHLVEETYFNRKSIFLMKVLITNDLSGIPLRKDYFNSHGARIPYNSLQLKAC